MRNWVSCPLGELMIPKNDKAKQVKSTEYSSVGSYPIVDQSSSFICGFHDDEKKLISTNLPLTIFGDHTRHTKFLSFPFIAGADGTQLLKAKDALDDKFFFYLVSWAARKIGNYGYDRHFKHLKEFHCDYPESKPEQTKIAEILSTVDRAIEQTEALIAKQQRIKTGLMQDLLTRGIDEHGNLRSEQTHPFKDSPIGRVPVGWEVVSLGDALQRARGFLQTGPFGSQLHAHEYVHEGIPVIMPQDIHFGKVSTASITRIPECRANDLRRHRVQPNDIVFSRRGDLSRAAAIGERETGWLCGTGCFLLRVPIKAMDSRLLADVYRHHQVQRQVDTNAVGSTMPSLNNGVMEQLTIAFPNVDEQREITRRRDAMDATVASLVDHMAKLCALKTALMQDLLTGKVRVTPLLNENEANS